MDAEAFHALLDHERRVELVEALAPLTERERKALLGPLRKASESVVRSDPALCIAWAGCAGGTRQVLRAIEFATISNADADLVARVLGDRRPPWLADLPGVLITTSAGTAQYAIVRALVRRGLVAAPVSPDYTLRMIRGVTPVYSWQRTEVSVQDELRSDPTLREDVWELFRTPGAGKDLATHDRFLDKPHAVVESPACPERTWRHALAALAADGEIDRSRLLDETLAAFLRDFPASDVTWFVGLHTALAPSTTEVRDRQATYARLLSVGPGQPVAVALKALGRVRKDGSLDTDVFLANVGAVLQRPDKGNPAAALTLLASLPVDDPRVRDAITLALDHEDNDVREQAKGLLQDVEDTPDLAPAPTTPARYAPVPVHPLTSADDLAQLLSRLLEEADDPIEVERALDGAMRFAETLPQYGAAVLADRAAAVIDESWQDTWSGEDVRTPLAAVTLAWLRRTYPGPPSDGRVRGIEYEVTHLDGMPVVMRPRVHRAPDWTLRSLIALRLHQIALLVHAGGGPGTLSLPTSSDGSLSAAELNRRLAAHGRAERNLGVDGGFAALRVPPAEYERLELPRLHRAARTVAEGIARLSTYSPRWSLVVGRSTGMYQFGGAYENAAGWTDLDAVQGAADDPVAGLLDTRDPLSLLALQAADCEYATRSEQVTAVWALTLPHHPGLLAVHAHPRLNRALVKNRNGVAPLLAALGRGRSVTSAPQCSALVLGLAARNAADRASAVDAVLDLVGSALLDGHELGRQLAALLTSDVVVGSRVAAGLDEVRRATPTSSRPLLDCLVSVLPVLPGRRDAHRFVDLLAAVAADLEETVVLPADLSALAASTSSSTLAKACRRVPQP